jgi:KaiC/GvpD/RAD55 family RecA-like ATPase
MEKLSLIEALREIDYSKANPFGETVYTENNLFALGHLIAVYGAEGSMKTTFTVNIALDMLKQKMSKHMFVFDADGKGASATFKMGKYLNSKDADYIDVVNVSEKTGLTNDKVVLQTIEQVIPKDSIIILDSAYTIIGDLIDAKIVTNFINELRKWQRNKNLTVFYITHTVEDRAYGSKQQGWAFSYAYFVEKKSDWKAIFSLKKPFEELHRAGFDAEILQRGEEGLYDIEYQLVPRDKEEELPLTKEELKELQEATMLDILRLYVITYVSTLKERTSKTELRNFIKLNINLYKDSKGNVLKRKSKNKSNVKSRFLQANLPSMLDEMYEFEYVHRTDYIVGRNLIDMLRLYKFKYSTVPTIITESEELFNPNRFISENQKGLTEDNKLLKFLISQKDAKNYALLIGIELPKDFDAFLLWELVKEKPILEQRDIEQGKMM